MSSKRTTARRWLALLVFAATALLVSRYAAHWLRRLLLFLSAAPWARRIMSSFGPAWQMASRFVAGETIDAALEATVELNRRGMSATLDYLGESVATRGEAQAASEQIVLLLDRIAQAGVDANVSLKLSQLGVNIDPNLALENMRRILSRAKQHGNRVRIDMEDSDLVDSTLEIYRTLRDADGFDNVGVVIQSYLYRSRADVERLAAEGAWVRLVKGAYLEPADVAYPEKQDVDENFLFLAKRLLSADARQAGAHVAVATHDERLIEAVIEHAEHEGVPSSAYEFQLLYGIRRALQEALVARGRRLRIYVPYGTAWYPYFMRRLAERPANLWFFIANYVRR